jgi:ribonuclease HI
MDVRPEKYVSICSESQVALKTLEAATTYPLVQQCQKVLNNMSSQQPVGLFWDPRHSRVYGNEIADEFARQGTIHWFAGP